MKPKDTTLTEELTKLRLQRAPIKRELKAISREIVAHMRLVKHFKAGGPATEIGVEFHQDNIRKCMVRTNLCHKHIAELDAKIEPLEKQVWERIAILAKKQGWSEGYELDKTA